MSDARGPRNLTEWAIVVALAVVVIGLLLVAIPRLRQEPEIRKSEYNLKHMALAIRNLASQSTATDLPPTFNGGEGFVTSDKFLPNSSFFFNLVPYIEADRVYADHKHMPSACVVSYKTFQAPADPTQDPTNAYTSYGVNNLVFNGEKPPRLSHLFARWSPNVILLAERYAISARGDGHGPHFWARNKIGYTATDESGFQLAPYQAVVEEALPQAFSSGGINVLLGDGSVRVVAGGVSPKAWLWANDPKVPAEPAPSDW